MPMMTCTPRLRDAIKQVMAMDLSSEETEILVREDPPHPKHISRKGERGGGREERCRSAGKRDRDERRAT
jgi:hypothetical protein